MINHFLLLTISFCLYCNTSFSQLDSVSVSISFVTDSTLAMDTLIPSETMKADIWVNDTDFVGKVMISVYDQSNNRPMARVKYSHAELLQEGYISGNVLSVPVGYLDSTGQYSVKVQLQNFQLNYLSPIEINYP
ncbi:MAG: hypothetical protein HWE22_05435 [Flavobacteriales bacterium]|nr:hypothetical protein [Flavobacteriales bacterium]